jgi:hypothetical protein
MTSSSASPDILPLIHAYYASKPNFSTFFDREREPQPTIEEQLKKLGLDEEQQKDPFLQTYFGKRKKMPVHPAEENATGSAYTSFYALLVGDIHVGCVVGM